MAQTEAMTGRVGGEGAERGPLLGKLYVQVLIAIAAGVLLGVYYPKAAVAVKPLGDVFISLIRSLVPVIVFLTVAVGIAKMGSIRRVGVVGLKAMIYFEVVSTLALLLGLAVGNLLQPGAGLHINLASLDTQPVGEYVASAKSMTLLDFFLKMSPSNLVGDIAKGEIMPVLIMAVLFGCALCTAGEPGKRITQLLDSATQAVFAVVRIIMYLAPLAAFAGMAFTVGKFGFATLMSLGQLIATVYATSILFMLVGLGLIARLFGLRILKLIRYFKDELLIAFSATSSDAMIPRSIAKLEAMGCSEEVTGLVLPAGFSFNTDGTAIYMTLGVLFIAQATDIPLSIGQQLALLVVMLFTAKGAAGYTGAGFVALAATLPASGVIPVAGLVLLLGIDRFMAEIRAVTNLFSNIFATVVVARWMGELDQERAAPIAGTSKPSSGRWPAAALATAGAALIAALIIAWPWYSFDTGAGTWPWHLFDTRTGTPEQSVALPSASLPVTPEPVTAPPRRAAEAPEIPAVPAIAAAEPAATPPPSGANRPATAAATATAASEPPSPSSAQTFGAAASQPGVAAAPEMDSQPPAIAASPAKTAPPAAESASAATAPEAAAPKASVAAAPEMASEPPAIANLPATTAAPAMESASATSAPEAAVPKASVAVPEVESQARAVADVTAKTAMAGAGSASAASAPKASAAAPTVAPRSNGTRVAALPRQQPMAPAERAPSKADTNREAEPGRTGLGTVDLIIGGSDHTLMQMAQDLAGVINIGRRLPLLAIDAGSAQDIVDLEMLRGADVAIAQADILEHARENIRAPWMANFTYIAKLNSEELHVLARPEIETVRDLAGKKVAFAGGAALTGRVVLDLLQIKVDPVFYDPETALANLKSGQIAALAYVAAKPAPLFHGLTANATFGLHFLAVPSPPEGLRTGYVRRELTGGDYPDLIGTDGPIRTVGVSIVMVAANLSPMSQRYRNVADFVDAFFSALPLLQKPPHHPAWKSVSIAADLPGWTRFLEAGSWVERENSGAVTGSTSAPRATRPSVPPLKPKRSP